MTTMLGLYFCGQVKIKDNEDERIGNFGRNTNWNYSKEIHNAYKEIKSKTYKDSRRRS